MRLIFALLGLAAFASADFYTESIHGKGPREIADVSGTDGLLMQRAGITYVSWESLKKHDNCLLELS